MTFDIINKTLYFDDTPWRPLGQGHRAPHGRHLQGRDCLRLVAPIPIPMNIRRYGRVL